MKRADLFFIQRQHAVLHALQGALHGCQRGAQFVGHICHHVAAQGLGPVQVLGHAVEGLPQFTKFVTRANADALAEIFRWQWPRQLY